MSPKHSNVSRATPSPPSLRHPSAPSSRHLRPPTRAPKNPSRQDASEMPTSSPQVLAVHPTAA
eukprot:scaffold215561_cov21-Attheya_sp.AAC.1